MTNGANSGAASGESDLLQAATSELIVLGSSPDNKLLAVLASPIIIDNEFKAPKVAIEPARAVKRATRSLT